VTVPAPAASRVAAPHAPDEAAPATTRPRAVDDAWTLERLVDAARRRSAWTASLRARVEERGHAADEASAWDDPVLALSYGRKRVAPDDGPLYDVSLSQPLGVAGRRALLGALGRVDAELAGVRLREAEAAVARDVVTLAYRVVAAERKRTVAEARRERFELVRGFLNSRPFASPQALAERRIVEARLARLATESERLDGERRAALAGLAVHVPELPGPGDGPDLDVPWLPGPRAPDADAWREEAGRRHFGLAARRLEVDAAEQELRLARNARRSDVTLSVFYGHEEALETERVAGLGVSFPLRVTDRTRAGVARAESRLSAERSLLAFEERETGARLDRLWTAHAIAADVSRRYPEDVLDDMERQVAEAEDAFRKGRLELLTFLELDAEAAETSYRALDAQAELAARLAELASLSDVGAPGPWFGAE
jgi:outer membrane protein TolC